MASTEQTRGLVRKLANQFGIEISRLGSKRSQRERLGDFLLSNNVSLVFDVGANVGEYGRELRALGYGGRIISFEPLSGAHARLKKSAAGDPQWIVAPRTAIGSEEGVISVHASRNCMVRSALQGANLLSRVAMNAGEQVPLLTLNSLAPQYVRAADAVFLKIDVPGFEYEVLDGADKILNRLCGVQLDVSLVPLYRDEKPFRFILDLMESKGFRLQSLASVFAEGNTSGEIQLDAIFIRRKTADRVDPLT